MEIMKIILISVLCLIGFVSGCSLPPERPVTKEELFKSGIYNYYTIKESPERVLAELNRVGEVVLEAQYKNQPVYIKIMATNRGVQVTYSER
jgi:hypothetical protein